MCANWCRTSLHAISPFVRVSSSTQSPVHTAKGRSILLMVGISGLLNRCANSCMACRVKWGNLERPCKSSVDGKLQVEFLVCNVSVN